ncbi:MAG: tRNA-(ms[2]io[6]A)-hydroxylase [Bacteroidetes bacterium]|nr:tRNA-(ms[2]io[6]A)-hydroxylase [Bacteroidota bacterium]
MKLSIDLRNPTRAEWADTVMADFDTFLQDHADCERKASSMMLSMVAKYPNRTEIIPEIIDTALEELEHFRDVAAIIHSRGRQLENPFGEDPYIKGLMAFVRTSTNERFLDRLLLASLFETRGMERFKMIWERLPEGDLKKFYHRLWAAEAKHAHIFVKMALMYFDEETVYSRLHQFADEEGRIVAGMPLRAALH